LDQVYIEGLKVESLIGVYEFERHEKQTLFLDIELDFDCSAAGKTDDLNLALDYDALSRLIRKWSSEQTFELLETYGEQLCELINRSFKIEMISLKINKPAAVADCVAVGISIKRRYSVE
jgi:dihydroneopterin aldolase